MTPNRPAVPHPAGRAAALREFGFRPHEAAWRRDTRPRGLTTYRAGSLPTRAWLEEDLEAAAEQRPDVVEWEVVVLLCSEDWAP